MMAFSIRLLPEYVPNLEQGEKAIWGVITIGAFRERFIAPLDYWGTADYERHWKQAITRIIRSSTVSCLITSMHDPANANFLRWWPMYRLDDTIFIQNHILFLDRLAPPFDPNNPYSSVSKHETVNEEGEEFSEWSVSIQDLESFLQEASLSD